MIMIPFVAILIAAVLLLPMVKPVGEARAKKRLLVNSGVFMVAAVLMVSMTALGIAAEEPVENTDTPVYASDASTQPASDYQVAYVDNRAGAPNEAAADNNQGMGYLAAALAVGLSCIGAGIAIASTAPAAIGAFSEDPKAFGKALIFVVLGEGVALYGLLISILLINKL